MHAKETQRIEGLCLHVFVNDGSRNWWEYYREGEHDDCDEETDNSETINDVAEDEEVEIEEDEIVCLLECRQLSSFVFNFALFLGMDHNGSALPPDLLSVCFILYISLSI